MLFDQKEQTLLLKNALKNVIGHVFRVNISFDLELHVEGTLGVTVDRQKSFVFHFDDKLDASQNKDTLAYDIFAGQSSINSIPNYLGEPMNLSSTPIISDPSISEVQGFDPVEADPQLEVEVESMTIPSAIESLAEQISSKMMRNYNTVSDANKFDPMISAYVISDAEDDLSFSPQYFVSKRQNRKSHKVNALSPKRTSYKDSKESVFKKISRLKRKTAMFSKKMNDSSIDALEMESNLSTFSFECSVDSDSKVDLLLKNTTKRNESRKRNQCEVCGIELKSISQLEGHLVSKHGITDSLSLGKITSFCCSVCHKSYRFQAQLVKHSLRHEAKKPFCCKVCRNSYRCEESLKLHMQVHNASINLNCHLCMKSYSSKILFQKHIAYMHEKVIDDKV